MKIKGITWVGVKADRFEVMRAFCKDVPSLSEVLEPFDFAVFRAGEHDKLEIFGPAGPDHPAQFASNRVVCGFEIDDIEGASQELQRAGIELIGGAVCEESPRGEDMPQRKAERANPPRTPPSSVRKYGVRVSPHTHPPSDTEESPRNHSSPRPLIPVGAEPRDGTRLQIGLECA